MKNVWEKSSELNKSYINIISAPSPKIEQTGQDLWENGTGKWGSSQKEI